MDKLVSCPHCGNRPEKINNHYFCCGHTTKTREDWNNYANAMKEALCKLKKDLNDA